MDPHSTPPTIGIYEKREYDRCFILASLVDERRDADSGRNRNILESFSILYALRCRIMPAGEKKRATENISNTIYSTQRLLGETMFLALSKRSRMTASAIFQQKADYMNVSSQKGYSVYVRLGSIH